MPKKVAIIIINYKDYAEKFLAECRDSLRIQNYPKELYQVYIVDNASSQESRRYLGEQFAEAVIIPRQDGNYTAANNAGLNRAIKDGFEYVVIANMDVKFDKNWLKELCLAIDSDKSIGIAQSKILLYKGSKSEEKEKKINSLGNIIHFLGFGFTDGYRQPDKDIEGYPEIKGYPSGCSFIIKKEVLDKIKGYNEELYMYHDDLDIGWKTKLAGYKIVLAPESIVYHKYSFARSVLMVYYMERNRYLAVFTFYKCATILLILPALVLMDIGMLFFSIINGWFKTKIKVYYYFLKPNSWLKIFKARKEIQEIRKVKDKEMVKNFFGKVLFQEIDNPVLRYIGNPILNIYWQVVKRIIWW
ncbi:MAG: glycosyltransferase family 2 protein [Patescibacteria group bacterium]